MKSTKYTILCLKAFGKLFSRFTKDKLEEKNLPFVKANIQLSYEEYYSVALMNTILGFIISFVLSFILYLLVTNEFTTYFLMFVPLFTTLIIAVCYIYYPGYRIKVRATDIDLFLPYAINFISSMAVAGISPSEIFHTLSTVTVYGEVQAESKRIANEISVMGGDNITALKHAIEVSPSRKLKVFLQGIIGTIQSGSDLHIYLGNVADKFMENELTDRYKDLDLLAVIAEVMVLTVIAFPILLVIILTVFGFFGGSMESSISILLLFSFIILPAIYATFYFMIKSTSVERLTKIESDKNRTMKQFYIDNKPSIFIFLLSAFSIMILFILIIILGYYNYLTINLYLFWDFVFLALLIFLGPIGVYSYLLMKRKRDMQYRLPDFLIEVGDSLSTGMNIFDAVKTAEKGNYGALNPEIKQMRTQLSWTVSMKNVLFDFADRLKTAIANRVVIVIDKGLLMGGNTPKIFKAAAREVDQVNQIETQRRTMMSIYALVIVVCFAVFLGIILILNGTIYNAFYDLQAKQQITSINAAIQINLIDRVLLEYTLYSFVFIQSIGAGILAGFMMDGKLSAGVRYSCVLGIISIFVFKMLV